MMRGIAKIPFHKNLSIPSRNQSTDPKSISIRKISIYNCFPLKQKENSVRFPFISPKPFSLTNSSFFCTQKAKKYDNKPLKEWSDRTDWKILRDIKQLEKNIGQFIQLPELPFPKGFTQDSINNFLLTKQRFQLLSEILQFIEKSKDKKFPATEGMCLSGPQGVGKTAINYLFACFGWANEYPVLYIPLVSEWTSNRTDDLKDQYLINRFWALNQDICKKKQYLSKELIKAIENQIDSIETRKSHLFQELGALKTAPVFYLFDEHNEIFRENVHSGYWRPFTIWTSVTSGTRTFTVYSGSAHSAFEMRIPSGEENKLRYVHSFEKDEFATMIKHYELEKKFNTSPEEIEESVGRIPRYIVELAKSNDLSLRAYIERKQNKYFQEIEKTWDELKPSLKSEYMKMLDDFFFEQKGSNIRPIFFYDRGLFEMKENQYKPINGPAKKALLQFWANNPLRETVNLHGASSSEIGWRFERLVKKALLSTSISNIEGIYIDPTKEAELLQFKPQQIKYFDKISSISPHPSENILYIPLQSNFKYWDCFIHYPKNNHILFIQISIVNPLNQEKRTKIVASFDKTKGKSFIEKIVSHLLKKRKISINLSNGNVKCSVNSPISFVYIWSGKKTELIKTKREEALNSNNCFKDLIILDRESCQQLGVLFD